jgi:hypothetical protein
MNTKYCKHCQETKPTTDFGRNVLRADDLQDWCKKCMNSYTAKNPIVVEEKQCRKCQLLKPASEFYTSKRCNDGLQPYCKPCTKLGVNKTMQKIKDRNLAKRLQNVKTIGYDGF